jgi:plasmid stabilization system protein ParE
MEYEVIIAPRAIRDLEEIVLYVTPDRPEAAKRLALALVARTKILGRFPDAGRVVPEFSHPAIRELILLPYRVVYRVDREKHIVGVARFWHGARHRLAAGDI